MKKIVLFSALLIGLSMGKISAQVQQGKVLIGFSSSLFGAQGGTELAGIGLTSYKYKSDADNYEEPDADKYFSFNLSPKVGLFVSDNFLIGTDIYINLIRHKDEEYDYTTNSTVVGIGPYARYYFASEGVMPFGEITSSLGRQTSKIESDSPLFSSDKSTYSYYGVGLGVGIAAPLGDRVMIETILGYNSTTYKNSEDNEDNVRTVIGNMSLKLGVTFLLGE